jgi:hypothetical protein
LVQVTLLPAAIVNVAGSNAKFLIATAFFSICALRRLVLAVAGATTAGVATGCLSQASNVKVTNSNAAASPVRRANARCELRLLIELSCHELKCRKLTRNRWHGVATTHDAAPRAGFSQELLQ